jgi:hypothetical protein
MPAESSFFCCGCPNGGHVAWCVLNAAANPRARDAMMLVLRDMMLQRTSVAIA